MSAPARVFYLGGEPLHTGIYADLIRRLHERGLEVPLIGRARVSPNPSSWWRAWRGRDRLGPNALATLRGSMPAGVTVLPVWNLLPQLSLPWLMAALGPRDPRGRIVLHARQIVMARLALALRRRWPEVRVIVEMEGDDLAELDYRRSKSPRAGLRTRVAWGLERRFFETQVRRIVGASDAVICVSANLRDVLIRRHAVPEARARRFVVIPTFASRTEFRFDAARRERARAALGIGDRLLVVYSGNLRGAWQVPDALVRVFGHVRERHRDAFFLVLTPDADRGRIEPLLAEAGLGAGEARVRSAPHAEIPDFLCAADVGLLLRDRHPMNEVAAPGKFGEYVLSGLPIVMTEGIGDFSAQMRDSEFACVLPGLENGPEVRERVQRFCGRRFTEAEREAFSRWAGERFACESTLPKLEALYRGF